MKSRFALTLLLISLGGTALAAQEYMDWKEDPSDRTEPAFVAQADPMNPDQAGNVSPGAGTKADLNGFADTPWKSTYSQVKTQFENLARSQTTTEKVEILRADRNQKIVIRRNDVIYRYSFYKTPFEVARLENHQITKEEHDQEEALLFHVKVTPIFIETSMIQKKMEGLYGPRSRTTIDPETRRGADIWTFPGGYIFVWSEPYRKTPYTRTIDYLSRELAERILKEDEDYFDAKEKQILKDLILG